jgi:DNA uptake protein ComE-like DNA-binding protein
MTGKIARAALVALVATVGLPLAGTAQVGANVSGLLDPNRATKAELVAVEHLTEAMVDQIIAARPILDMMVVDRILAGSLSEEQRELVYGKVWAPLDLNSASKEEIMLIPGVGERMHHEFEEYRPYPALAQFHREIDKYVDDTELARLEQYVFVKIDLNTATDEHILTIPGVGSRMLREFKEYRPYDNIEKFRREIGKYVDDTEVRRLEHYVTIRN